ncbi:MAG: 2OG-Fe(II) oxygenase [Gammaproteobacteria bacterium]
MTLEQLLGKSFMDQRARVREGSVEGHPIRVIDGLMPPVEAAQLFQNLDASAFTRNEFARPETQAFRHWACNIEVEACKRMPLYRYTMQAVAELFPQGAAYRLYRTYCNQSTYGDMLFTHTDNTPDLAGITALWYIAPRWDLEWGGETLLFDNSGDARFVVSPRPGRLLLFDGRIRHAGRPPSRICTIPRLTFALKLEPEQQSTQ